MNRLVWVWLFFSLLATTVTIPMLQYSTLLYGSQSNSQFIDVNFILEYIKSWWQGFIRRLTCQYGPAETTVPDPEASQNYTSPPTTTVITEPTNIYELIVVLRRDTAEYSAEILSQLEANGIPNKSTQIDLLIIPEKIYLTLYWDTSHLMIYDSWIGDQNATEYIVATATSDLVMNLYKNLNNLATCRTMVLEAIANGNFSYSLIRVNPGETPTLIMIQTVAVMVTLMLWSVLFHTARKKET